MKKFCLSIVILFNVALAHAQKLSCVVYDSSRMAPLHLETTTKNGVANMGLGQGFQFQVTAYVLSSQVLIIASNGATRLSSTNSLKANFRLEQNAETIEYVCSLIH